MSSPADTFDPGHLMEALFHFNEARGLDESNSSSTRIAEVLFYGLNKLQTGLIRSAATNSVAGFVELVESAASSRVGEDRLIATELEALASLEPRVVNHDVLRRRNYRPGSQIASDLMRSATEAHRKLVNALERLTEGQPEAFHQVLKRCAELLYVVRSNIAHGEKTPYGPDLDKRGRDEQVCRLVVPLCLVISDLLLGGPGRRLVVYGTLAPGQPNHRVIQDLEGSWHSCRLQAVVKEVRGLPVLSWQPGGTLTVHALLLESDGLPGHWQDLDRFEGSGYRRHLIEVSVPKDKGREDMVIANAYVGSTDVTRRVR